MMLFREVKIKDLEAIHHLAAQSGIGITTLSKDKNLLRQRILKSLASFQKSIHDPKEAYYFFVLEDTRTHKIVGTSAIEAATGFQTPFYSYKISKRSRTCPSLKLRLDYEILNLVNDYQNCTELCTLFLDPCYRGKEQGLLLSKARFLFMAGAAERFSKQIIAEMRGVGSVEGSSPFWEALGRHFFNCSFEEADKLTLSTDKQFISDSMPRHPIYVKLLPQDAQAVLGQAHKNTKAAMHILLNEGFSYHDYIDIFDAGPTLEAPFNQIRSIRDSELLTLAQIKHCFNETAPLYLISAMTTEGFKASCAPLLKTKQNKLIIEEGLANLLEIQVGANLRIIPLHFKEQA